jgi:hypothetical protein
MPAANRSSTPSLARTAFICDFTVSGPIPRSIAITSFDLPSADQLAISACRGVRLGNASRKRFNGVKTDSTQPERSRTEFMEPKENLW